MEDFIIFISFIFFIFGILALILFFKVWRMTDDVKNIRISLAKEQVRGRNWMVSTMLMRGDSPEAIHKYLVESFSEDIYKLYKAGYTEQAFTKYADAKIIQYQKLYDLIKMNMPGIMKEANTIAEVKTVFRQG